MFLGGATVQTDGRWIAAQTTSSSTSEALGPSESNASAAPTLLPVLQFYRAKQKMTNNSTEQSKAKPSRTNCDSIAWLHFWFQTEGPAQSMA